VINPSHFMPMLPEIGRSIPRAIKPLRSPARRRCETGAGLGRATAQPLVRPGPSQHPSGQSREAIDRATALALYTAGGAYAEFTENDKGRLVVGQLADFAVLDRATC
jgi:hypothetical protein